MKMFSLLVGLFLSSFSFGAHSGGGAPARNSEATERFLDLLAPEAQAVGIEDIRALLEAKADVNVQTRSGTSPVLHLAIACSRPIEIIQILLDAKANSNSRDTEGRSDLQLAASESNSDYIILLLNHGATDDSEGIRGISALFYSCRNKNAASLKALIAHDSDVNATGMFGITALHEQVFSGDAVCVSILLEAGANFLAVGEALPVPPEEGYDYDYFVQNLMGSPEIIARHGNKPFAYCDMRTTAYDWANQMINWTAQNAGNEAITNGTVATQTQYEEISKILRRWPLQVDQAKQKRKKSIQLILFIIKKKMPFLNDLDFIRRVYKTDISTNEEGHQAIRILDYSPKTTDLLPEDHATIKIQALVRGRIARARAK